MENQKNNFASIVVPIFVEILIILVFSTAVIFVLNYFKVIKLSELFSNQEVNSKTTNISTSQMEVKPTPAQAKQTKQSYPNPVQPNISIVATNKAIRMNQTITEVEGKIINVDTKPGFDTSQNASYSAKITLGVGKGNDTISLLYPKEAEKLIKITNQKNKELNFGDIKVGDNVIVRTNTGNFRQYPLNVNEVKITIK